VRGGDAGGYRRDDKGRKDGGSDAHGRHTDCYGDRREETFRVGTAEALAGTFKAQNVANTLWAYATMVREPGAGVMRELEGRAEALAGTFNAQDVVNTLWGVCVIALLCAPGQGRRWLFCLAHTARQRLVTLGKVARFNTAQLRQFHQFFVGCSVEPRLRMEAINDIGALKETCREAFECRKSAPSATQQDVGETLRHMGMLVEDEARCPKSGYSIDMITTAAGGKEARGAAARARGRWN